MDNELNVSLGLDTSKYESTIDGALKKFNEFQTALSSTKLGFDGNQIKELNKIFTDIRTTALTELSKIQKRMDTISAKGIKLNLAYDANIDKMNALKAEIEATWNSKERAKLENQLEAVQAKLATLDADITINDDDLKEAQTDYNFLLKELQDNPLEFDFESPSLIKFNTMIDNVLNGLKRTGEEFDEIGDKAEEMGNKANNSAKRVSTKLNLMGRVMSQIKNTIAAAINPLNVFRKVWNNVIMTDTSKFGNTFKTIGQNILNFLTPAFENIAQWIINLIGYINIFLKALTGGKLDLFAKTAKSAKSTAESVKEINKQVAGFDEINDIGDSGGGSSGGGIDTGVVEPNLKGEWVKKLTEWGEKAKKIYEDIKEFFTEIKDNIGTIALVTLGIIGLVGAFALLNKITGGIGSTLIGIGVVLAGLAAVILSISSLLEVINETGTSIGDLALIMATTLGTLTIAVIAFAIAAKSLDIKSLAGLVIIFAGMVAVLLSLNQILKTITESGMSANDVGVIMISVMGSIAALAVALTLCAKVLQSPMAMGGLAVLTAAICATLLVVAATLPTILDAIGKFITTIGPTLIQILNSIFNGISKIIESLGKSLPPIIKNIGLMFTSIFSGVSKVIETVGKIIVNIMNTAKSLVVTVLNSVLSFINRLGPAINNFVDNCIRAVTKLVNFMVSAIEYMVNATVVDGLNAIIRGINTVGKYVGFTIPKVPDFNLRRFIPSYDVGTEFVPNDMLAYIHEGEAVIPKKFNDKSYFEDRMGDNEETNRLLNQVLEAINDIDFRPYTTIKDVGQASVEYIKEKSRALGRSVV